MNLAGVLPWIHWRGLLILGLLGGRQRLLHGLPVHAAADARPPLAARRPAVAALAAEQVAGRRLARALPLGYEAFALWDSPWLTAWIALGYFVGGLRRRRLLPRRGVLQVRLPDRPVQLRAVAGLAAGGEGPRAGRLRDVPDEGLHPRQRRHPRLRAATCSSRARPATWTARSASIASTPARTTTSASSPAVPARTLWSDPLPLRHRPLQPAARPGGPGPGAGLRRVRQRRGHGRAGRRVAGSSCACCSAIRRGSR